MAIVLKENEWAAQMIRDGNLGRKPSETLRRVARYYLDNGFSPREVRAKMDAFLLQCEPTYSLPKWSDALDYAMRSAQRHPAIDIDYIEITDKEIETIDALDGRQVKRLAFTLLCLAKYWKTIIPDGEYWVNNKDNEIMSMANIDTSIKRQCILYSKLHDAGLVKFSKKVDNTNVMVEFVSDGNVVMQISDFRNLGYQYQKYKGEPYFECVNCGIVTKLTRPSERWHQKYCKDCAHKVHLQKIVESVMRGRKRKQSQSVYSTNS